MFLGENGESKIFHKGLGYFDVKSGRADAIIILSVVLGTEFCQVDYLPRVGTKPVHCINNCGAILMICFGKKGEVIDKEKAGNLWPRVDDLNRVHLFATT